MSVFQGVASSHPQILPKKKAPGVDFFGVDEYYYIIRSDLGCYMRSTNFHEGKDLEVFTLHNSCRGGDHYLAHEDDFFYIIKGNDYRRVTNLNKDYGAKVSKLHPKCRGGDFYLSSFDHFYIIFQSKGIYRKVKHLDTAEGAVDYHLHAKCKNGLYYWGLKNAYYFLKPVDKWGVQYYRTTNFQSNTNAVTYSIHADVVNFLPGGLGITHGSSFGRWEAFKTITNDLNSPVTWTKKITKKVGYEKQKMSTIEKNWKVSMSTSAEAGGLTAAITKYQFSIASDFGGSQVNTDQEKWSEATEVEESISVTLQPKETMYVWQYQLGLGKEAVLFCRSMKFTKTSKPPTEIPLPPSKPPK
ncbi:hypothetical protein lerEdw1_015973 [Lerista edwardsae]|nr:hypothetical protein lerEdw1_015973 [Lerista edwardsae]